MRNLTLSARNIRIVAFSAVYTANRSGLKWIPGRMFFRSTSIGPNVKQIYSNGLFCR